MLSDSSASHEINGCDVPTVIYYLIVMVHVSPATHLVKNHESQS